MSEKTKGSRKKRSKKRGKEYYIEVDNLVKVYGEVRAVDGISLKIRKGEIFAFLGPNGAGKTTTVEIIETIRTPTKGKVRVKGKDVAKNINEIKKIIGVLPQEFSSFDKLKVRETLHYYSQLYDKNVDVDNLLKVMNIDEHKDKLYENLSGGLKQRVGVAAAMVNDPEILFLDEPTTGLDPGARHEVWDVISDLKKEGKTIFLTTHYMEEAEELADHIAIIHRGKIIAEGAVDELVEKHGTGLFVTFKGGDEALVSMIGEVGYEATLGKKGDISVSIEGKDDLIKLLTELKSRGANYAEVNVRRSNLEEVFLRLTGEKLRGGDEE